MKFVDEFRNPNLAKTLQEKIFSVVTKPWTIMEVCGGQTHSILRYGIDQLLPPSVKLLHGPGCPVCVTPAETLDKAFALAANSNIIFCTFADMLRVPGSTSTDLFKVRANGGDIRMLYSPIDALAVAKNNPTKEVVFFAVGFETTAPAHALAVVKAKEMNLHNFSLLVSHVLVPPALEMILQSKSNRVQGFLAAGHVCSVMGYTEYEPIVKKYKVPIVVTGFEPLDILEGLYLCLKQLENNLFEVENQYSRVVRREGNIPALEMIKQVFETKDREWRGIGNITRSGLGLRREYASFDAEQKFVLNTLPQKNDSCLSGEILLGAKKPTECPQFSTTCKPETPRGATMISSEGACSAYYRYRRENALPHPGP